jgi:uncharacterized membrane protein YbhN (UPF0104 family)
VTRAWRFAIALLFYALLAAFLVRYLRDTDWSTLARLDVDVRYLLLALPLSLATRFVQPLAWRALIEGYGEPAPPYPQLTHVYALSWLGRYIPGKVAWIGAKILFGREHGVSAQSLAASSVAEAILHLSTALAVALLLSAFWGDAIPLGPNVELLAVVALAVLAVALIPSLFDRVLRLAASRARAGAPVATQRLRGRALLTAAATYVTIHAMSGIPVFLIVRAMHPTLDFSLVPELTAAILIAGTMGTLAVFAPAGLGVREGILIVALGALMPRGIAVAAVVVLRLWAIAVDLVFYTIAALVARRSRKESFSG